MQTAASFSSVASPPDPPRDRPDATILPNLAAVLQAVGVLLGYGRHLVDTLRHRVDAPHFNAIAAAFGTARLYAIYVNLYRGILRAAALERFLLALAATGQDLDVYQQRPRTPPQPARSGQPAARRPAEPRPVHPPGWVDPEFFMPSPEDIDRQVRRCSIGHTIGEICKDLAVVPGFCTPACWNQLHEIMHRFGGNVARLMQRVHDRKKAFVRYLDSKSGSNWDWLRLQPNARRQILGFLIGEPPVNPYDPAAAPATGPP